MDSLVTYRAQAAGAAQPLPSPPADDAWLTLDDPARGLRRLRRDAQGRPELWVQGDGTAVRFRHDTAGSLRRVASGNWFVAIEAPASGPTLSLEDQAGRTDVTLSAGGRRRAIRRGADELVLELDVLERQYRVELPGSAMPLRYEWDADGGCVVRMGSGPAILTLTAGPARRIEIGEAALEERLLPGSLTLRASIAGLETEAVVLKLRDLTQVQERRWRDGGVEVFDRDERERLVGWTQHGRAEWVFCRSEVVAGPAGSRELDDAGRVSVLRRPDGGSVRYEYDGNGRRVRREQDGQVTQYVYAPLGELIRVERPGGRLTQCVFDGMGRRVEIATDGVVRREHRDEFGRLWSVTDAAGQALHSYVWIGDRIAARIDGPVSAPVTEAYLTDPFGTPLIAVVADGDGWVTERCHAPPYGHASDRARPGIDGHFADPDTGLIHFGGREFDSELELFLTPDPWHGGADDPRRWAGLGDAELRRLQEFPAEGVHPYALCQFDPLGHADRDGHFSGWDLLRYPLMLTWGFPLTSVSLFFFEPLNLYMEVIGLIVWAFKGVFCDDKSHPWGYHTIAKATGLLGSSRQATFALGLNGFLPRVISGHGPGGDRAVTVGNVIWINRDELSVLGRPEVLEVADLAGGAAGAAFSDDASKVSMLALLGTDGDGKQRIHASVWTRGYGNAVQDRGPAGTQQPTFVDVASGGGSAAGTIMLRQPIPFSLPAPQSTDDKAKLEVWEFRNTPAGGAAADPVIDLVTAPQVWFAVNVPSDTNFIKADWVRVTARSAPDPKPDAAFMLVRDILPADDHAAMILSRDLPVRFSGAGLSKSLRVEKVQVTAGAAASDSWDAAAAGTVTTLSRAPADPVPAGFPPDFTADAILQIVTVNGTVPPALAGMPAGAAEGTSFSTVKALRVVLTLAPDAAGVAASGVVFRRRPHGSAFNGTVTLAASPNAIKLTKPSPSISKDDLLIVLRTGVADPAYVRATADPTGDMLTIDPALPAAMLAGNGTAVTLQRTADTGSDDKAAVTVVAGADVTLTPPHGGLFSAQGANLVRIDAGGAPALRRVTAVKRMEIDVADMPVGTGPFTLTPASTASDRVLKSVDLELPGRFLKWSGVAPAAPASLGQWPGKLLAIRPELAAPNPVTLEDAACYVRWPGDARPGEFHKDFHRVWSLATTATDEYVVLETPLPLVTHKDFDGNVQTWWRVDGDDYAGERDLLLDPVPAGGLAFKALEFTATGTKRGEDGKPRVLAQEPELLVPVRPTVHDTHRRALIEHETHHTVQCNFWGPLMTALPLPGLIMTGADLFSAAGNKIPDWMQQVDLDAHGNPPARSAGRIPDNTELNPFQVVSLGGMMQLAWKYVILSPLLLRQSTRTDVVALDFNDFNKVFNPLSRLITDRLPQVDHNAPAGTRWLEFLGQILSRALDLRSWTPFLGFVPTLLPDGAKSFIEQGASRASGDLYSTILSANDQFNLKTSWLLGSHTDTSADLHPGVGRVVRLLIFPHYRTDRLLQSAFANAPGTPVTYRVRQLHRVGAGLSTVWETHPVFTLQVPAGAAAVLVDARLFEAVPGGAGAAPTVVSLQGPGAAHPTADFLRLAPGGAAVGPTLRALVPMPPRVNRTAGFYFVPSGQGTLQVTGFYSSAGDAKNDAGTQTVTLTIEDKVLLDSDEVAWTEPAAAGSTPTTVVHRFQTEEPVLKVQHREDLKSGGDWQDQKAGGLQLDVADPALKNRVGDGMVGWKLTVPATGAAASVRVRIYRTVPANDPAFDLHFQDVPSLSGKPSYLDGMPAPIFAVVRDFLLQVDPLPAKLDDKEQNWNDSFDMALPCKLLQKQKTAITVMPAGGGAAPVVTRKGDGPGRGETWTIGALASAPKADVVLNVRVVFGNPGNTVERPFKITRKAPPAPKPA